MILIVDDLPENIIPIKRILENHNFLTDTATSGEEALKKVLYNDYSVIILDVQMPVMDGFEVAEILSSVSKANDIPIIFLSAVNTDKKFVKKGYESGGIDYLSKPVDPDILILKVRTFQRLYLQQKELKLIQLQLQKEVEFRKQAENSLKVRVQDLNFVLESLPQLAFTIKSDGQLEYTNQHWKLFTNDPLSFPEIHPNDNFLSEWKNNFQLGEAFTKEVRLKDTQSDGYLYFLLRIIPIPEGTNIVRWVGTFTNIHQQMLTSELLENKIAIRTEELVNKNLELESSNHELQQFAWVVSHDLKEPLRKIQTFNSLIKDKYLFNNPDAIGYLNRSITASARMSLLISDLLEYSRLSVKAQFQLTNINDVINDLLVDYENIIEEKSAKINIDPILEIETIPSQIRQVFQNLVGNALKFSKANTPPEIRIWSERIHQKSIDSPLDKNGNYCRIIITDNGIGFNEKFLDRIFMIFQRLNNSCDFDGTGIGLAIAKKIMDKHQGIISARSSENSGSQFLLVLPITQTQDN